MALKNTVYFLTSILETQDSWVLVMDNETKEILYTNEAAKKWFYNPDTATTYCDQACALYEKLHHITALKEEACFIYFCDLRRRYIEVKSFPMEWDNKKATLHCLTDRTREKNEKGQLQELVYKDELTGIYNRRHANEMIQKLYDQKEDFTVVLVDLDNLKHVNDTYGHSEGDMYICTVVDLIQHNIRTVDTLSRIGGDEFSIILVGCSEEAAKEKLERIVAATKAIQKHYTMGISYGVACVDTEEPLDINAILHKCDVRMYAYKKENK